MTGRTGSVFAVTGPVSGLVAGVFAGAIMAAPRPDVFMIGNAINLAVLASLWLGTVLAGRTGSTALRQEVAAWAATLLLVALVFQLDARLLIAGFALQAIWAFLHHGGRYGSKVASWYPVFAGVFCIGNLAAVLARFGGVI